VKGLDQKKDRIFLETSFWIFVPDQVRKDQIWQHCKNKLEKLNDFFTSVSVKFLFLSFSVALPLLGSFSPFIFLQNSNHHLVLHFFDIINLPIDSFTSFILIKALRVRTTYEFE